MLFGFKGSQGAETPEMAGQVRAFVNVSLTSFRLASLWLASSSVKSMERDKIKLVSSVNPCT